MMHMYTLNIIHIIIEWTTGDPIQIPWAHHLIQKAILINNHLDLATFLKWSQWTFVNHKDKSSWTLHVYMLLALKSVNGEGLNQRLCYTPGKQHQHHNHDTGQKSIPLTFITKFNLSSKIFCQQNHEWMLLIECIMINKKS